MSACMMWESAIEDGCNRARSTNWWKSDISMLIPERKSSVSLRSVIEKDFCSKVFPLLDASDRLGACSNA